MRNATTIFFLLTTPPVALAATEPLGLLAAATPFLFVIAVIAYIVIFTDGPATLTEPAVRFVGWRAKPGSWRARLALQLNHWVLRRSIAVQHDWQRTANAQITRGAMMIHRAQNRINQLQGENNE